MTIKLSISRLSGDYKTRDYEKKNQKINQKEKIQTKATMKKKMYYLRNTRLAYLR